MIGAGKTTYVSLLAEYLASQAFYESVDDNPILSKFYQEPVKYGFMSQVYFIATRFASIKQASEYPRFLVDRAIQEDLLFAQVNHDLGRISDDEKIVYDTLSKSLVDELEKQPTKNLYVYLTATFETILKRIAQRDRSFEQDAALLEYYKALHVRYDDWMKSHIPPSQLLTIDTEKYDVMKKEDRDEVFNQIRLKMAALGI